MRYLPYGFDIYLLTVKTILGRLCKFLWPSQKSWTLQWYLRSTCFHSFFGRIWRHQKDISKYTDLQNDGLWTIEQFTYHSKNRIVQDYRDLFWFHNYNRQMSTINLKILNLPMFSLKFSLFLKGWMNSVLYERNSHINTTKIVDSEFKIGYWHMMNWYLHFEQMRTIVFHSLFFCSRLRPNLVD